MQVRIDNHDFEAVIALLERMHEDSGLDLPEMNPAKIRRAVYAADAVFGAYNGPTLAGVLILQQGAHWYSDERFLGDLAFFVAPEQRATTAALALLRAAKKYAKLKGLPLMLAVVDGRDVLRKAALYERAGFTTVGTVHISAGG